MRPDKLIQPTNLIIDPCYDSGHTYQGVPLLRKYGRVFYEKDFTLTFGLLLGSLLNAHPRISVMMLRSSDRHISHKERVKVANELEYDMVFMLQCVHDGRRAKVIYSDDDESYIMGQCLFESMNNYAEFGDFKLISDKYRQQTPGYYAPVVLVRMGVPCYKQQVRIMLDWYALVGAAMSFRDGVLAGLKRIMWKRGGD